MGIVRQSVANGGSVAEISCAWTVIFSNDHESDIEDALILLYEIHDIARAFIFRSRSPRQLTPGT